MSEWLELNGASLESAQASLRAAVRALCDRPAAAENFGFESITGISGIASGFLAAVEASAASLTSTSDRGAEIVQAVSSEAELLDARLATAVAGGFTRARGEA